MTDAAPATPLARLTWVDLQQALYDAWTAYDTPETKPRGRERILEVYAEYRRRGVTDVVLPDLP